MVFALLYPALLPWCHPSSLPHLPSSVLFSAPHPPFSLVGIPDGCVHAQDLSLSTGCFLQVRVMSWRFHGLTLLFHARNLSPDLLGALGDHVVPSPSSSVFQVFLLFFWKSGNFASFFLEICGSGWQGFKYILLMERRKGIELFCWEVITAPFKLGFWCILSVRSNRQEFPSPLLFLSPVSLQFTCA